jgi:phage pi2 protein 07
VEIVEALKTKKTIVQRGQYRVTKLAVFCKLYGIQPPEWTDIISMPNLTVAGGAVRAFIYEALHKEPQKSNDIDVFMCPSKNLKLTKYFFYEQEIHHVKEEYKSVEALLSGFDFTINQCAIYMNDQGQLELMYHFRTLIDIENGNLIYNSDGSGTHPIYHVKRIGKFIDRGYRISNEQVLELCELVIKKSDDVPEDDYEG